MGLLFHLPSPKNDMVIVLEDLLNLAHINPVTGLLVIAQFATGDVRTGMSGCYLSNPDALLAAIKKVEHKAIWEKSNLK